MPPIGILLTNTVTARTKFIPCLTAMATVGIWVVRRQRLARRRGRTVGEVAGPGRGRRGRMGARRRACVLLSLAVLVPGAVVAQQKAPPPPNTY